MTINELQKFNKMYILSRLNKTNEDYLTVHISIDVEAWNNNFRRTACEPVGREFFDRLFNVDHYKRMMNCFEYSMFLLDTGVYTPEYSGQYGGIDGLCQKA